MSILETPRILFRGQIAWDPIVTNNSSDFYDETTGQPTLPPAATSRQRMLAFRKTAIAGVVGGGNWNPHGTHRSTFFETEVSGVDTGSGVDTADPFVGTPVGFTGMLVDCEPYGADTSQLFFDEMAFGIPGGCLIDAKRSSRMTARFINFRRNSANTMIAGVASVVWQTSFAKTDGLFLDAHNSPALQALETALAEDDVEGLTVRWNSYRTVYYGNPCLRNGSPQAKAAATQQQSDLLVGGFQPNPARSLLVGVLGLWRRGEPAEEPGDRPLLAAQSGEVVASAHARLHGETLTLDLQNSIAEVDDILTKQNLGTLTVEAVGRDGSVVAPVATLNYHQYDRPAYEQGAGIVTLPLDPSAAAAAADNLLRVRSVDGTVYLAEREYRPIPTDHNRYLDERDQASTTAVQLFVRGAPAPGGLPVTMYDAQYGTNNAPVKVTTAVTAEDGVATFPIAPRKGGGLASYLFVGGPDPVPPPGLDPQLTPYMYLRTLPCDDDVAQLPPTWDNVYGRVLVNWNAMAPCMDNWLRLDDPSQVHAYGDLLRKLTDPANFEAYRFMPVTRDMTAGERTLLWAFLDAPEPPEATEEETLKATTEPAEIPTPRRDDLAALSRAMRGN